MSKWKEVILGDLAIINPKEKLARGMMAKKISMDRLKPYTRDISNAEIGMYNGGSKFKNKDIIMARITPCLENGKIAMINILDRDEVGFGSTEFIVFRAIPEISDADFLYYLICSSYVRSAAIKSMVGSSGRQRVQVDSLQNLVVKVPDFATQKKIGQILKCLDDKILINTQINDNLEQQAKLIFDHIFKEIPIQTATYGTLADIAIITMGQSPAGNSYNEAGNGIVFYQGRAEFGHRFPTRKLFTTAPKHMAQTGDILFSVRAPVGDINIATEDCCIGRGLSAIRSKDGHNSFLLYTLLKMIPQFKVFNGEGTVFGAINKKDLNSMPVLIPSKKYINQFEQRVHPLDQLIYQHAEETRKLQEMRNILLPFLMQQVN